MKSTFPRILAIAALIVSFAAGNAAYAKHENENKFTGVIESLPSGAGFVGDWRVSGRTVHVTSSTSIEQTDGRVAVGATVKVEGTTRSDNSVDAREIEVNSGGSGGGSGSGDDSSTQPSFKGTIQALPSTGLIGDWLVGGRTIHVSSSTRIQTEIGPVVVGAFVEIKGTVRADGSMDANKIETKSNVAGGDGRDEINGTIQSLPSGSLIGNWTVSGRIVHVTLATVIDQEHGAPVVGAQVEVKGTMRADGSLDATKIEVRGASGGSGGSGSDEGQSTGLKGTIQNLPSGSTLIGEWLIGDRIVHVTSSTRLNAEHGAFVVGTRVQVKGLILADGSIVATKIQSRD